MLDIATDRNVEARILVIHLRGRIDALTAREFDEFFEELLRSGERFFILRGNQLEAVSSAGIGSLVKFVRRLRGLGGGAAFVRLPEEIRLLLEFFGLGELLPVYESLDDARASLEESLVQFQDSLELKRESTLRGSVRPARNEAGLRQRQSAARAAQSEKRNAPDVYARPLDEATESAGTPRTARSYLERAGEGRLHETGAATPHVRSTPPVRSEQAGPTESELELMAESGPTESELEVMASAGPTEAEREVMADGRATESKRESADDHRRGSTVADSRDARYERAMLEDELAREAAVAENDSDLDLDSDSGYSNEGFADAASAGEERVMGCEQCGLNLRIFNFGLHMCPACGIEFDVRRDGNVSFYEKL